MPFRGARIPVWLIYGSTHISIHHHVVRSVFDDHATGEDVAVFLLIGKFNASHHDGLSLR